MTNEKIAQVKIIDGITHLDFLNTKSINLEAAKEIYRIRKTATNGQVLPICVTIDNLYKINPKSLKYFSTTGIQDVSAIAIIVKNRLNKFMYDVFYNLVLKEQETSRPTQSFTTKKEALSWLKQY